MNHRSPRRRRQNKDHEKILEEIIVENFSKMRKETVTSPRNPESPKQDTPKVKSTKTHINQINENQRQRANIKSSKGKAANNTQGIPIRITADLSIVTLQARREWQDILKVMEEKNLQSRRLYPARISFKYEGEIKSFTDTQTPNQLFNKC